MKKAQPFGPDKGCSAFVSLLLMFSLGCHQKEKTMVFVNPEQVCLGRLRVTVPGPGVSVVFNKVEVNGATVTTIPLTPNQTFDSTWSANLAGFAEQNVTVKSILDNSPFRKGALTRTRLGQQDDVLLWQLLDRTVYQVTDYANVDNDSSVARRNVQAIMDNFVLSTRQPPLKGSFCIQGGAVAIDSKDGEEISADVVLRVGDSPLKTKEISFDTVVVSETVPDDVVTRNEKARIAASSRGISLNFLKIGQRRVAGMSGHEAVFWSKSDQPESFSFSAEFSFGGVVDSNLGPRTTITFSDTHFPKSIKPEDLFALWNTILDSIRVE